MLPKKQTLEVETNFLLGTFLAKLTHLDVLQGSEDFISKFKLSLEKDGEEKEVIEAFEKFIRLYLK